MRILVTGASGFLGRALALRLARAHEVIGTCLSVSVRIPGCALRPLDLRDPASAAALVRELRPEAVVHLAALSNAEACARAPEDAVRVNVDGTEAVARACAGVGARLLFMSTDLVYDGERPPYREGDEPKPLNLYARTKLEGEARVRGLCPDAWVLRLALGYGWKTAGSRGFTDYVYGSLTEGRKVRLFTDQIRTPTFLGDATAMIQALVERGGPGGTLHLAGPERASRLRFGEVLCEVFGFDPGLLEPVRMEDVPSPAPRPRDCSLDGSALWKLTGHTPLGLRRGFEELKVERGTK